MKRITPHGDDRILKTCVVSGFQDTRTNKEDYALTPYLFGVCVIESIIRIYGIGICWGWYSVFFGIGFNVPKKYSVFIVKKYKKK